MHVLCGLIVGGGLTYTWRRTWLKVAGTCGLLGAAITLHAIYNLLIAYGGAALGIIVAAHEFNANRVTLPGALCIILLSADFFLPMRALGSYFHVAMNGMAASDKIFKLLDLPEGSARTAQLGADCAIACRDLHFGYTAEKENAAWLKS